LRFEWTAHLGLEASSGRLLFSPEPDDSQFLNMFRHVAMGSLDQETSRGVTRFGLEGQVRNTLSCYRGMQGHREWWRLACTPEGRLVGFTIPSANEDGAVIGYLGVVPEFRGNGYAVDLLGEATRILAANGAERIRADTDTTNRPMIGAFERGRYRNFGVRLVFSGPDPTQWPTL
jgi:ribosomal protein S18 acetylase RimI-like enzyme